MQPGYPAGSQPPDPNVPQPPDAQTQTLYPQAQQAAPGPTLGQANGDPSGLPPGNPILDQYNQAIASTLDTLTQRGLIQPMVPPQPGPGFLESLGTFGIANLKHIADENTRREQNYVRTQQNRAVALKGVDLATKMVDSQVAGGMANQRLQLAIQGQGLQIAKFLGDQTARQNADARNQVKDNFGQNTIPAPLTQDLQDHARDLGFGPSTRFPGRWELQDDSGGGGGGGLGGGGPQLEGSPATGWNLPANAPMRQKLDQVGGGGAGGGGGPAPAAGKASGPAPLVKRSDESFVEFSARKKLEDKKQELAAGEAAKTGPYANAALADLDNLQKAVEQAFPANQSALGAKVAGIPRYIGAQTAQTPDQKALLNVQTIRSRVEKYVRSMGASSRMPKELVSAILSGLPDLGSNRERNLTLIDQMRDQIKRFSTTYPETGTGADVSAPGPQASLGGTQPTPSTAPTSLEGLLQKHGY